MLCGNYISLENNISFGIDVSLGDGLSLNTGVSLGNHISLVNSIMVSLSKISFFSFRHILGTSYIHLTLFIFCFVFCKMKKTMVFCVPYIL